jgi:glycogen operon protein
MSDEDWDNGYAKSLAVFLNGGGIREIDARGQRISDDSFLLLFNAHYEQIPFTLPDSSYGEAWTVVVDTAAPLLDSAGDPRTAKPGAELDVPARSVLVLQRTL